MGMGIHDTTSPSPPSFIITYLGLVGQSVSRGWLAFFYLEKGKKKGKRSPGCRRKHHGKRKKEKKKKTRTTSSMMM